jgi:hypothetical protein
VELRELAAVRVPRARRGLVWTLALGAFGLAFGLWYAGLT